MATPTVIVLVAVGLLSLLALAAVVVAGIRQVGAALETIGEQWRRVLPALERLESDAEVTRRELDTLSQATGQLARRSRRER